MELIVKFETETPEELYDCISREFGGLYDTIEKCEPKAIQVQARVIQHTENFNKWLDKYFISDGSYYCYKTKSGHKLFTLKELYKKFEQAYHEKPSVSA